jgi:hypothetical protein
VPIIPQDKNVSRFHKALFFSGTWGEKTPKIILDNPVEGIELDLNNFIKLGKAPSSTIWN